MKLASPPRGSRKSAAVLETAVTSPAEPEPADACAAGPAWFASEIDPADFRNRLMAWYKAEARDLPWRGTIDPYRIWVSEIMLQQTRVAAVIDHYNEFLRRFPTLVSLSLAPEPDVLAEVFHTVGDTGLASGVYRFFHKRGLESAERAAAGGAANGAKGGTVYTVAHPK